MGHVLFSEKVVKMNPLHTNRYFCIEGAMEHTFTLSITSAPRLNLPNERVRVARPLRNIRKISNVCRSLKSRANFAIAAKSMHLTVYVLVVRYVFAKSHRSHVIKMWSTRCRSCIRESSFEVRDVK